MKLKLQEYIDIIDATVLTKQSNLADIEITEGYVSDLLSDVMGNAKEGSVWITIMRHLNVIAVASLAGLGAVVFSKNIVPEQAVIDKANEEGICLINSSLSTFELAGKLYGLLQIK
jgi:predicted transcriptional regulator